MPFPTDTNWLQGLLSIFNVCRSQAPTIPSEARYYGSYDKLLNYTMTEGSFAFFLAPLALLDETSEILIYDVSLVVYNQDQKPVLFPKIKGDRGAIHACTRQRYEEILYDCPIPHLYGLCLFGTSLRVYCGDKDTDKITPDFVGHDSRKCLPYDFLEGEWDLDILSLEGLKKMQEIVAYIKAEVANVEALEGQ